MRFTKTARGELRAEVSSTGALELRGPFPGDPPRYFLRNVTAGVFGCDDYEVAITVEAGARVSIAPTSAAKVFNADGGRSTVTTRLEIGPDALLDFDAGVTIPHAAASLTQSTEVILHPTAAASWSEVLSFGRIDHGERFAFDQILSTFRLLDPTGAALYERTSDLVPASSREALTGAVATFGAVGTLLALGEHPLRHRILAPPPTDATYLGSSELPHGVGIGVHALDDWPESVSRSALLDRLGPQAS